MKTVVLNKQSLVKLDEIMLKEGDVIEIKEGHKIYADVPKHFVFSNRRGCYDMTHTDIIVGGEFAYFIGKYIVVEAKMDGGSRIIPPWPHPILNDFRVDGHHVYCVSVDEPNRKIDFYQSGCFTAMIKNINPIGKAELRWQIVN